MFIQSEILGSACWFVFVSILVSSAHSLCSVETGARNRLKRTGTKMEMSSDTKQETKQAILWHAERMNERNWNPVGFVAGVASGLGSTSD